MRTLLLLFFLALAQPESPDYAITNIRIPQLSAGGEEVTVAFDVVNNGIAATVNATVRMVNKNSGMEVATEIVRPLLANEGVTVSLTFPASELDSDDPQTMLVSVGLDEVEPSTGEVANNMANILIPRLDNLQTQEPVTPTPVPPDTEIDILGFEFDTADPAHIAALVGMGGALLVMLLLLVIIVRLLFRRRPTFEVQPPPYINVPPMSAASTAGRRQGWQFHAQNDLPPPLPSNEGATHIRKLLIGVDGRNLSNWEITGLRMSQYDQYGRVSRSEIIAKRGVSRRLSKIANKADSADDEQINRWIRPLAGSLARQFKRKIGPRSAMLPIALDIRFQGVHGEVRILFELYYMEQGRWKNVDSWEPEMTVTGKAIHENFTYTLHGLRAGEDYKAFPKRLQEDLTRLLVNMLKHNQHISPGQADSWSAYRPPEPPPGDQA